MPAFVLLPSVFLPTLVWEPVAAELRRRGFDVTIARADAAAPASTPEALESYRRDLPAGELVLVAHSNAGNYVPGLLGSADVVGAVFVDAVLPETGRQPVVPSDFAAQVEPLAEDGVLPPWSEWFESDILAELVEDAALRERLRAAQPRVPVGYLRQSVEVPEWPASVRPAYVAFGDGYADEIRLAASRGWPVTALHGGHLHLMNAPAEVAAAIARANGGD